MAHVLDLTHSNKDALAPSGAMHMEEQSDTLSARDVLITAAVVIPASVVWVVNERLLPAIAVATLVYATYAAIRYGVPLARSRTVHAAPLIRTYEHARGLMRTRTAAKRA
ncbi:MAG TPA: hypothetical protein VNM40_00875 [Candidatus Paceibacterota bacterium]|nr:hypothetical protein [Candidatus Paceibacterota bacterium]